MHKSNIISIKCNINSINNALIIGNFGNSSSCMHVGCICSCMYSTISQGRKCNLLLRKRNDGNMEKGGKYHVIRISILILNVYVYSNPYQC